MPILIIFMSHKDLIKTKQAMLRTRSNMVFFGTQGQVPPKWMVPSDRNSNSSEMIRLKVKALSSWQLFLHYKHGKNFLRSRASNSVNCLIWPEIECVRDFMTVIVTCKSDEGLIKNEGPILWTTFSPIISLWELSVAVETRVWIQSAPKPYAAFLPPQWCYT